MGKLAVKDTLSLWGLDCETNYDIFFFDDTEHWATGNRGGPLTKWSHDLMKTAAVFGTINAPRTICESSLPISIDTHGYFVRADVLFEIFGSEARDNFAVDSHAVAVIVLGETGWGCGRNSLFVYCLCRFGHNMNTI